MVIIITKSNNRIQHKNIYPAHYCSWDRIQAGMMQTADDYDYTLIKWVYL